MPTTWVHDPRLPVILNPDAVPSPSAAGFTAQSRVDAASMNTRRRGLKTPPARP